LCVAAAAANEGPACSCFVCVWRREVQKGLNIVGGVLRNNSRSMRVAGCAPPHMLCASTFVSVCRRLRGLPCFRMKGNLESRRPAAGRGV